VPEFEFLAPLIIWFIGVELSDDTLLTLRSRSGVIIDPARSKPGFPFMRPPLEPVELLALRVEPESEELALMTWSPSSRLGRQSCKDALSMAFLLPSTTKMTCNWYLRGRQHCSQEIPGTRLRVISPHIIVKNLIPRQSPLKQVQIPHLPKHQPMRMMLPIVEN